MAGVRQSHRREFVRQTELSPEDCVSRPDELRLPPQGAAHTPADLVGRNPLSLQRERARVQEKRRRERVSAQRPDEIRVTDGGVGVGAPRADLGAGGIVQFRGEEGEHGKVRVATPGGGEIEINAVTAAIAGLGGLATVGLLLV